MTLISRLVGELCPTQAVDTDTGWQAWLAGNVLLEIGRHRRRDMGLARDLDERVRWRLVELPWADRPALSNVLLLATR